ncbi:MAG TPA: hypothetical protein VFZ23_03210 [Pyrinomonadaceae bacterium]
MRFRSWIPLAITVALFFVAAVDAQTKRRTKTPTPKPAPAVIAPTPDTSTNGEPIIAKPEPKKNERPTVDKASAMSGNGPVRPAEPTYFYEFSQPEFTISRIVIEHDDTGKGTITFTKKMFNETATDPLQVSPAALARITAAYTALNFLDSTESYQYEKDYSHLGVSTFRLKKAGKQRTTTFNYTLNKDAKALADEYRRLSNQFIWIFDITVARENQPLEAPRLLDALDALIRRNEISDPAQMIPELNSLANDERIPLIARNHAKKLVERIERKR